MHFSMKAAKHNFLLFLLFEMYLTVSKLSALVELNLSFCKSSFLKNELLPSVGPLPQFPEEV
jgi:hypothetical protein